MKSAAHLKLDLRSVDTATPLARTLFCAAKLYEAMNTYHYRLRGFEWVHLLPLGAAPPQPLQPRQTLHEAYTLMRSRDLVENQAMCQATAFRKDQVFEIRAGCSSTSCMTWTLRDIRTVPTLVMVDQLSIWILDAQTIVTSFPEEYGSLLRFGQTGIHKIIKERLVKANASKRKGWTVFDLAIAVLEECCYAFSGSTDCPDGHIEVFAEEIYRQVWLLYLKRDYTEWLIL